MSARRHQGGRNPCGAPSVHSVEQLGDVGDRNLYPHFTLHSKRQVGAATVPRPAFSFSWCVVAQSMRSSSGGP